MLMSIETECTKSIWSTFLWIKLVLQAPRKRDEKSRDITNCWDNLFSINSSKTEIGFPDHRGGQDTNLKHYLCSVLWAVKRLKPRLVSAIKVCICRISCTKSHMLVLCDSWQETLDQHSFVLVLIKLYVKKHKAR